MAITLTSKPGLTPASALYIPKDWDQAWFRRFVADHLKYADVRNAVGLNGITVSGTLQTGYANITYATSASPTSQIVFDSGATAATSFMLAKSDQKLYSLLGRTQAGPGIQARWDSATTNRYYAIGTYDNSGTWTETMRWANGQVTGTLNTDGEYIRFARAGGTNNPFLRVNFTDSTGSSFLEANAGTITRQLQLGCNGTVGLTINGSAASTFSGTITGNASADGEYVRFTRTGGTNNPFLRLNLTDSTGAAFLEANSATTTRQLQLGCNALIGITINGSAAVQFNNVSTTASAANAFLDNANSNNLLRSTSSRRYKTNINDLQVTDELLKMRPVTYTSLSKSDNPNTVHLGFIAEEVDQVDQRLVYYVDSDSGNIPESVQYERITVLLVAHIQRLEQRLAAAGIK